MQIAQGCRTRIESGMLCRDRIDGIPIGIGPSTVEILGGFGAGLVPNGCDGIIRNDGRPVALIRGDEREQDKQDQG
jgi:hypothetical protein